MKWQEISLKREELVEDQARFGYKRIMKYTLLPTCLVFITTLGSFFFSPLTVEAQLFSLDSLLSELPKEALEQLRKTGEVFRYDKKKRGALFSPNHSSLASIKNTHKEIKSHAMVEGLYLIPYPEGTDSKGLDIYNITRQVETMDGIPYFSSRKKAYVPMFTDVYRIESMKKKKRMANPLPSRIPKYEELFFHIKETHLGKGHYKVQYVYDGESLGIFIKNMSVLRVFLKIFDKEKLLISLILLPTMEGLLVYGHCEVQLSNRELILKRIEPFSAFYRRLYAIETWLYNSLLGTDRLPALGKPLRE